MAIAVSRLADSFVQAELYRLQLVESSQRDEITALNHDIVLWKNKAEAAEQRADVLLSAQETNLKLLDRINYVHGQQSGIGRTG